MPISERIIKEVENANASDAEKKLMLEILQVEEKGTFRYQAKYEDIIRKYIDKTKEAAK